MCRDFPINISRAKSIIGNVLKFAGYVHNKSFPGNISLFILKNKMATTAICWMVIKEFDIL